MTNIGAINSKQKKHMVSQKIMDFHENLKCIIAKWHAMSSPWKTKLLLIAKDKNIFN